LPTICFIKEASISYSTIKKLFGEVIWEFLFYCMTGWHIKKGELAFLIAAINTIPKILALVI
jgi:hypothetical protein